MPTLTRREFLLVASTAAGGLAIGTAARPGNNAENGENETTPTSGASRVTPYITIRRDGTIEIFAPKPDVGTGTLTSLPMIVAEELDADWGQVVVRQAEIDPLFGDQGVGGSDSVMAHFDRLRQAGALGRTLLLGAAAAAWRVSPSDCRTERSRITNLSSGASLSYGDLAAAAATQPVPEDPPALKDPKNFTLVGTRQPGSTIHDVVRGAVTYGIDMRVPGMLRAVIQKCPVYGGRVRSVDDSAALAVSGVRRVVVLGGAERHIWMRPGVAVIADSTWAALKGRDALKIVWDEGDGVSETTAALRHRFADRDHDPSARVVRHAGDPDAALRQASSAIDVTYELPFLPHLAMEPINCVAHVEGGRCHVWGPIQLPERARDVVSAVIGLPKEAITITVTRIGGGFGRRLLSDYAAEAAYLSKIAGVPMQIVWSREDDVAHDYFRAAARHRVRAGVGADGRITAWDHHVIGTPNDAYPGDAETAGLLAPKSDDAARDFEDSLVPSLIPHYQLRVTTVPSRVQTGSLRAPGHNVSAFVVQSAIDELAHASGIDALELRLRLLGDAADFPFAGRRRRDFYDPGRLKNVLRIAAQSAGWGEKLPAGTGRGLAGTFTMSSYAAHVIDVSVGAQKRLAIHRVVSVVDCGRVVNMSGVEAQIQGAVIDGLSAALFGEIEIDRGKSVQKNFDTCRLLRNREAPPIEIHVVPSTELPTGLGEIPYPAVAPALTSAIFAATGTRIRRLPVSANGFTI
jgi:isoquinoline 1-oxidoreductase beta subunit